MVKQIAGRAGRRSSRYPYGEATCLQEEDLPYLRECVNSSLKPITKAGIFPASEQLVAFRYLSQEEEWREGNLYDTRSMH